MLLVFVFPDPMRGADALGPVPMLGALIALLLGLGILWNDYWDRRADGHDGGRVAVDQLPSVAEGVVENRLADGRLVRASLASPLGPPAYALDGRTDTAWNSGSFAPAWIEIEFGAPTTITEIGLPLAQSPAGETIHEVIWISATGVERPLAEFRGVTRDGEWLTPSLTTPVVDVDSIRISTQASPSWVAWREFELVVNRSLDRPFRGLGGAERISAGHDRAPRPRGLRRRP